MLKPCPFCGADALTTHAWKCSTFRHPNGAGPDYNRGSRCYERVMMEAIKDRDRLTRQLEAERLLSKTRSDELLDAERELAAKVAIIERANEWINSPEVLALIGFCESIYSESIRVCNGAPPKTSWHWIRDVVGESHVKTIDGLRSIINGKEDGDDYQG